MIAGMMLAGGGAQAASPAVAAMETNLYGAVSGGYGDYEPGSLARGAMSGVYPGLVLGGGILWPGAHHDDYGALSYRFGAGELGTASGVPDRGSFNRVEARLGVGMELASGAEIIPYFAFGYQCWNQAVPDGGGAVYQTALLGGGGKLDLPLGRGVAASVGVEVLALAGGASRLRDAGNGTEAQGVTPQERVELGLDAPIYGPVHMLAGAYLDHFTYLGGNYEPFSATTEGGVDFGLAYSFY
jgi:hypothetical protein